MQKYILYSPEESNQFCTAETLAYFNKCSSLPLSPVKLSISGGSSTGAVALPVKFELFQSFNQQREVLKVKYLFTFYIFCLNIYPIKSLKIL